MIRLLSAYIQGFGILQDRKHIERLVGITKPHKCFARMLHRPHLFLVKAGFQHGDGARVLFCTKRLVILLVIGFCDAKALGIARHATFVSNDQFTFSVICDLAFSELFVVVDRFDQSI